MLGISRHEDCVIVIITIPNVIYCIVDAIFCLYCGTTSFVETILRYVLYIYIIIHYLKKLTNQIQQHFCPSTCVMCIYAINPVATIFSKLEVLELTKIYAPINPVAHSWRYVRTLCAQNLAFQGSGISDGLSLSGWSLMSCQRAGYIKCLLYHWRYNATASVSITLTDQQVNFKWRFNCIVEIALAICCIITHML